jgi:enoyl-CoA hydratase/carnithine racemase
MNSSSERPVPRDATVGSPLLREDDGGIAILTLNRPEARNSLSEALLAAMASTLTAIAADPSVRAVVLTGNGPVFSAGHDLKELNASRSDPDRGRRYLAHIVQACNAVMQQIVRLPQPVIAAVQARRPRRMPVGREPRPAIASAAAQFATRASTSDCSADSAVALSRNVDPHAMELCDRRAHPAEEAARIGLVNRVVPAGTERDEAIALLARLPQSRATSSRSERKRSTAKSTWTSRVPMTIRRKSWWKI